MHGWHAWMTCILDGLHAWMTYWKTISVAVQTSLKLILSGIVGNEQRGTSEGRRQQHSQPRRTTVWPTQEAGATVKQSTCHKHYKRQPEPH